MNTASNSSPLAECTVISCTASCPAWAWLSPASSAACVRKAASGDMISPVSASGTAPPPGRRPTPGLLVHRQRHRVLAEALLRDEALGRVDQFLEVLDAVLAFLVGAVEVHQAECCSTCSMISRSVRPSVASRMPSTRPRRPCSRRPPCRPPRPRSAPGCGRWRGRVLQLLDVRAPMPRVGKFTTRRKLVSSLGFSSRRR
jgi:hypothetical protein